MTLVMPPVLSWCFDDVDLSAYSRPPGKDKRPKEGELTAALVLDLIFGELHHESDRPVRDRLNEVLRQWHLRHHQRQ